MEEDNFVLRPLSDDPIYCWRKKKISYDKKTAQTKKNIMKKKGKELRIYHCPACNMFHLTHEDNYKDYD